MDIKEEHEQEYQEAVQWAERNTALPKLRGTSAQIRWAEVIRYKFYRYVRVHAKKVDAPVLDPVLFEQDSAPFWIEKVQNIPSFFEGIRISKERCGTAFIRKDFDKEEKRELLKLCKEAIYYERIAFLAKDKDVKTKWFLRKEELRSALVYNDMAEMANIRAKACTDFASGTCTSAPDIKNPNTPAHMSNLFAQQLLEQIKNKEKEDDKASEVVITPANEKTRVFAKIKHIVFANVNRVAVISDKNDIIKNTVKNASLHWDNESLYWYVNINAMSGLAEDRIAEIGNRLLNAGVPIVIDPKLKEKAVEGKYIPLHTEWLSATEDDRIAISWGRGKDLYDTARELPYSVYKNGDVLVKPIYYKQLLAFADRWGFKITPAAAELLKAVEEKDKKTLRVKPAAVKKALQQKDKLKDVLKSSRDVLDDLRDD